jgi:hypothetical protein
MLSVTALNFSGFYSLSQVIQLPSVLSRVEPIEWIRESGTLLYTYYHTVILKCTGGIISNMVVFTRVLAEEINGRHEVESPNIC